MALLEIENLQTHFRTPEGVNRAVDGVSFEVERGETMAIVGESGCGKSVTANSILRLVAQPPGKIAGAIRFEGTDLLTLSERSMRDIRGNHISMVFQEPMTSLNPVLTVGGQIAETLRLHQHLGRKAVAERAVEMLSLVGIAEPRRRAGEYPHQLSGGMRQRVMIAIALACNPKLLIADEPTTALDVTIQAQILDLMADLKKRVGAAIILITHDLGVVAEIAERVMVMYAGRKVEEAKVTDLFRAPRHPYTQGLLAAVPKLGSSLAGHRDETGRDSRRGAKPQAAHHGLRVREPMRLCSGCLPAHRAGTRRKGGGALRSLPFCPQGNGGRMSAPLLAVNDLKKHFPVRSGILRAGARVVYAVDGVSFHIDKGETLALVGESGCGKSTVGRAILRLFDITAGQVVLDGQRIDDMPAGALRPLRRRMQVVFQDPFSSLNPRMRVRDLLAEPIRNFGLAKSSADMAARIEALLDKVRLPRDAAGRWPHEFSGGQRQRIAIARALAADPDLIVCDEAVSALDVSVKAQIVNLLQDIQRELGLALLFISHDLAIVEHMTHRVAVMYLGKIVELGDKRQIFAGPKHPYTEALLSAAPVPAPGAGRTRIILKGDIPSPIDPPAGCRFHTRCPYAFDRCRSEEPALQRMPDAQFVACHLHDLPAAQNPLAAIGPHLTQHPQFGAL